jgi:proline iminopeptidase
LLNSWIVLFLHGGPGGQTSKSNTVYFDPAIYRVVLFDQRGAGKSTPNAELRENTTQHLVEDIETLRKRFGISKWHIVFGGSWGSTLALVYAQTHPDLVGSLILRGIFMVRKEELEWGTSSGACWSYPDAFEKFATYLPEEDRADTFAGYYKLLTSENRETRLAAARAWNSWEMSLSELHPSAASFEKLDDNWSLAHAILECHYFVNGAWLEEGQILKKSNLDKIRHIPGKNFSI